MNKDINELMTIAFIGFDGYSDIWDDCIGLLHRFWPDCPYRVLFVNNEKEVTWNGVEVLHAGKDAEWSRKVQLALKNSQTPYMCLLLEDFFIGSEIDTGNVCKTVQYIHDEHIRYYKLMSNRVLRNRNPLYKGEKFLHVIQKSEGYGISLQAAIWEKRFLEELVGTENYNAWIFEFNQVKAAEGQSDVAHPGCVFDDRNILNIQHGVIQSKLLPGTIRYFKKQGIHLNIQREVMSYAHYYKLRFIGICKYLLPKKARGTVKKFLERCGMRFVSTVRDKE